MVRDWKAPGPENGATPRVRNAMGETAAVEKEKEKGATA